MAPQHPTILQIIPELDAGGAELSTIDISEAIVSAGGRAIVLSEGGRMEKQLAAVGGEFVRFPAATKDPFRIIHNGKKIAELIRSECVDLVDVGSRAPAWSALKAVKETKLPFVTTYHGAYNEKNAIKKFYNSVMARGDLVIANSKYTARLIQQRYGTALDKIRIVYRGVDPDQFQRQSISPDRINQLRAQWGLQPQNVVLFNGARLTSWKGQTVIIEAARKLKMRGCLENVVVILAGDDQGRTRYRNTLVRQIAQANLDDVVRLVGHVKDVPAALALSKLAIVASTEPEAFGLSVTEAQSAGCPIIATNIGAPPETVRAAPKFPYHEITGWLIPANDPASLARAIEEGLSLTEEEWNKLGTRAQIHVAKTFSLSAMKQQTLAVYDELLGTQLAGTAT